MSIQPIETVYKGYRFRSRLEARWAVFFDALDVEWTYEPEGLDLGAMGWYLPDFWVRPLGRIEIKPEIPPMDTILRVGKCATILAGQPWIGDKGPEYVAIDYDSEEMGERRSVISECRYCPNIGFESLMYHYPDHPWAIDDGQGYCFCCGELAGLPESKRLMAAYTAARSARFEHGETPEV